MLLSIVIVVLRDERLWLVVHYRSQSHQSNGPVPPAPGSIDGSSSSSYSYTPS